MQVPADVLAQLETELARDAALPNAVRLAILARARTLEVTPSQGPRDSA